MASTKLCSAREISIWLLPLIVLIFFLSRICLCWRITTGDLQPGMLRESEASGSLAKGNDVSDLEMKHTDVHTLEISRVLGLETPRGEWQGASQQ